MATSARSPVVIFAAMAVSGVAVVVMWFAPVAGLVVAGVVVLGGIAVILTGRRAVGAAVLLMPFAVAIVLLQIACSCATATLCASPTPGRARTPRCASCRAPS